MGQIATRLVYVEDLRWSLNLAPELNSDSSYYLGNDWTTANQAMHLLIGLKLVQPYISWERYGMPIDDGAKSLATA